MKVSSKRITKNLEKQIFQIFYQLIADLQDPQEVKIFFESFLSRPVRLSLAKRLMIALLLDKKKGYQEIKKELKVSSSTVAETYKILHTPGMKMALKKIKADEWAQKWSVRISGLFRRMLSPR